MVIFANGKMFEETAVYGAAETYQSAQRKTLDVVIAADKITLEEAKALWQDSSATSEITIKDAAGTELSVQPNFSIPVELKLDTQDGVEVIHIKLAQKSALELAQEQQAADINDTQLALIELADLVAGGVQ